MIPTSIVKCNIGQFMMPVHLISFSANASKIKDIFDRFCEMLMLDKIQAECCFSNSTTAADNNASRMVELGSMN